MRVLIAITLSFLLSLPASANEHWPRFGDVITPTSGGLLRTSESGVPRDPLPFGTGFQDVMHVMVGVYGHDVQVGFPQECGAGPMVSASIINQIDLMFQDDLFVGWMMIGDNYQITETGLWIGAPRSNLAASGAVETFESGLGTEFRAGEYFGLLSDSGDRIDAVWVGTNCIFR